ncbi:HD domain-containing protein [Marinomonas sp. 15G1-11]|uniref:HD domain-containing protein n=1 Tax=Marinomonas phaeophyticola TaxID=3004091 RepID=A0ABT4JQI5_9GAMM|nr:HD domain-containing phosphohydrolase [Marinomonas sp. 15G1-11]MCZ2720541.1 HD domain-containing protein [Marinomonas sp. 15G1-11]
MSQFACKEFSALEKELKDDLLECYVEAQEEIESILNQIEDDGFSFEKLDNLFRSLHSMKGNCSVCFLDPLVDVLHKLEEIVDGMRGRYIGYDYQLGSLTNIILEEVFTLLQQLYKSHGADRDILELMQSNLDELYAMEIDSARPEKAAQIIKSIVNFKEGVLEKEKSSLSLLIKVEFTELQQEDIDTFKGLSSKLNRLLGYSPERGERILKLCLLINEELKYPEDPVQLSAAAYMHDMGMAVVLKFEEGNPNREKAISSHPIVGAQLLSKHEGWEQAVAIVMAHEEKFDGNGFPEGLVGSLIPTGAFVVSMAAMFIDVVWGKSGDEYKKSAMRAIQKVNLESGKHFPPHLIEAFNRAVRKLLVAKNK